MFLKLEAGFQNFHYLPYTLPLLMQNTAKMLTGMYKDSWQENTFIMLPKFKQLRFD